MIKKLKVILLVLAITLSVCINAQTIPVWDGSVATSYGGGSGTLSDPYLIKTPEQLAKLAYAINVEYVNNYANIHFRLENDIDLGGEKGKRWTPIGFKGRTFDGIFDGNSKTIHNCNINIKDGNDVAVGLFGSIGFSAGIIKNLTLGGTSMVVCSGTSLKVGSIVGYFSNPSGSVTNCKSAAYVYVDGANALVGGIIGGNSWGGQEVLSCTFSGNVTSISTNAGGIVGGSDNLNITNCTNHGNVNAAINAGGITGMLSTTSTIKGCKNTGNIKSVNNASGGIIGILGINVTVENCFNSGIISGPCAGGVVGANPGTFDGNPRIKLSGNTGRVAGDWAGGGIVGKLGDYVDTGYTYGYTPSVNSYISGCWNSGEVSGGYSGGIAAVAIGKIDKCFNFGRIFNGDRGFSCGGIAGRLDGVNYISGYVPAKAGIASYDLNGNGKIEYNEDGTGQPQATESTPNPVMNAGTSGYYGGSITNCYNAGTVSGPQSGGIAAAFRGLIKKCYNSGRVDELGGDWIGGVIAAWNNFKYHDASIAVNSLDGKIEECYWDGQMFTALTAANGINGKNYGEANWYNGIGTVQLVSNDATITPIKDWADPKTPNDAYMRNRSKSTWRMLSTREMITGVAANMAFLNTADWKFEKGLYPMLKMKDGAHEKWEIVSAAPTVLPVGRTRYLVNNTSYIYGKYGVTHTFSTDETSGAITISSQTVSNLPAPMDGTPMYTMDAKNKPLTKSYTRRHIYSLIEVDGTEYKKNVFTQWVETETAVKKFVGSPSDHKWTTATNWTPQGVPGGTENVTIIGSCVLEATDNITADEVFIGASGGIELQPGAVLTANTLTNNYISAIKIHLSAKGLSTKNAALRFKNSGEHPLATIIQTTNAETIVDGAGNEKDLKFHLISIPITEKIIRGGKVVSNTTYQGGVETVFSDCYLDEWDVTTSLWNRYFGYIGLPSVPEDANYFDVIPKKGYALNAPVSGWPITYRGTLHDQTKPLTLNLECASGDLKGHNLVGNPFTVPLSLSASFWANIKANTNVEQYVYLWDSQTKGYRASTPTTQLDTHIPVGQGFWMVAKAKTNVTIPIEALSVAGDKPLLKSDEDVSNIDARIEVIGENGADIVAIVKNGECSVEYDSGWDANKWFGAEQAPQLYAIEGENIFQINAKSDISETLVGFIAGTGENYTIKLGENTLGGNAIATLVDMQLGKTHNLLNEDYTFSASKSDDPNRFKILLAGDGTKEIGIPIALSTIQITSWEKTVFVSAEDGTMSRKVTVYDIAGRIIKEVNMGETQCKITLENVGAYIVSIIEDGAVVKSGKVMIR